MSNKNKSNNRVVATNKKARHRYSVLRSLEAGISLLGTEVKSLREGNASIGESYAVINNGEVWLVGSHIALYTHASCGSHDPDRKRKLLLHKHEIRKLAKEVAVKGCTVVPLQIYFNERGYAKVKIALVQGKKEHDKREAIKEREAERDLRNG